MADFIILKRELLKLYDTRNVVQLVPLDHMKYTITRISARTCVVTTVLNDEEYFVCYLPIGSKSTEVSDDGIEPDIQDEDILL